MFFSLLFASTLTCGVLISPSQASEPKPISQELLDSTLFSSKPSERQKQELLNILQEYQKIASEILVGTLMGTRDTTDQLGVHTFVDIDVERWIRGKGKKGLQSRSLPYRSPYVPGDPTTVSPTLIKGYQVLVFLNKYGGVVDGNAIFVIVNGHAFRHRRPDVFSNPLFERKWIDENPYDDYLIYELASLEKSIQDDTVFGIFRDWF